MLRKPLVLGLLALTLVAGCSSNPIPTRDADWKNIKEAIRSYYDYRRLEKAGVEAVSLTSEGGRTVSLAYYLFMLAQNFEKFGRESDAAKLYLRLLTTYPVIHEGGQLGVMAENRVRWLIGDKSWIIPSADQLIIRLEHALLARDVDDLSHLISRDFAFGRTPEDRFAIRYQDGLELIGEELKTLDHPVVEVMQSNDEQVLLKTTGWAKGNKTWYFELHKNPRRHGWEWDMAYWEQPDGYVP